MLETRYEFSEKSDKKHEDTNIEKIVDEWTPGKRLLILGSPGTGKSVTLLQLAKRFCEGLNDDNLLDKPIPVMLHLSTWEKGQSIDAWLIQRLNTIYGFPPLVGEAWVKNRKLFLLLDGIDQVNPADQIECAREINKFGSSDIAVCSRIDEYKRLFDQYKEQSKSTDFVLTDVVLKVDLPVYIKPLEDEQIKKYLETL